MNRQRRNQIKRRACAILRAATWAHGPDKARPFVALSRFEIALGYAMRLRRSVSAETWARVACCAFPIHPAIKRRPRLLAWGLVDLADLSERHTPKGGAR